MPPCAASITPRQHSSESSTPLHPGQLLFPHFAVRKLRQSTVRAHIAPCYAAASARESSPSRAEVGLTSSRAQRPQQKRLSFCSRPRTSRARPGILNDSERLRGKHDVPPESLSRKPGSSAHLLQRGVRVAQPGARRGVGGVAVRQHLFFCGNTTLVNILCLRDLQL